MSFSKLPPELKTQIAVLAKQNDDAHRALAASAAREKRLISDDYEESLANLETWEEWFGYSTVALAGVDKQMREIALPLVLDPLDTGKVCYDDLESVLRSSDSLRLCKSISLHVPKIRQSLRYGSDLVDYGANATKTSFILSRVFDVLESARPGTALIIDNRTIEIVKDMYIRRRTEPSFDDMLRFLTKIKPKRWSFPQTKDMSLWQVLLAGHASYIEHVELTESTGLHSLTGERFQNEDAFFKVLSQCPLRCFDASVTRHQFTGSRYSSVGVRSIPASWFSWADSVQQSLTTLRLRVDILDSSLFSFISRLSNLLHLDITHREYANFDSPTLPSITLPSLLSLRFDSKHEPLAGAVHCLRTVSATSLRSLTISYSAELESEADEVASLDDLAALLRSSHPSLHTLRLFNNVEPTAFTPAVLAKLDTILSSWTPPLHFETWTSSSIQATDDLYATYGCNWYGRHVEQAGEAVSYADEAIEQAKWVIAEAEKAKRTGDAGAERLLCQSLDASRRLRKLI